MEKQCPICTAVGFCKVLDLDKYFIVKCDACSGKIILPKAKFSALQTKLLIAKKLPEKGKEYSDYELN